MMKTFLYLKFPFFILFVFLHITLAFADETINFNCYSIVVGKDASADGSVLFGHNEDDFGDQILNLYKVPAKDHNQNEFVEFKSGTKIPQQSRTNGFIWIQLPRMEVSDAFLPKMVWWLPLTDAPPAKKIRN